LDFAIAIGIWYCCYQVLDYATVCFFIFPGNTGVAVMLYDPRRSNISKIEKESGVKFEHVSAPQANDIAKAVGREAAEMINQVSDRYDSLFAYCV
jgi:hypothetical protein